MDPVRDVPLAWAAPFALLLLSIAVLPLVAHHWWESNRNRAIVSLGLAAPVAAWCLADGRTTDLFHALHEYEQFLVLLGSLFVVSGGIFVDGDLRATPKVNTAILALGTVLASVVGTTGASMLLIRPLLRTNSERTHVVHTVVFFIFTVSNCGGLLTPLGDPPLFMGYLRGVPFEWTLRFWPVWLGLNAALLAIYFVWDTLAVRRETPAALRLDRTQLEPVSIRGRRNFVFLAAIVGAVAFLKDDPWLRDGVMVAAAVASLATTPKDVRAKNVFQWGPIVEVAVIFAGIFVTMIPALKYLGIHGRELGVDSAQAFFWMSGTLSSFLDNAPTYLTFTSIAMSNLGIPGERLEPLVAHPTGATYLAAVSLGAVLMGANTYIGNGPNFMVKAIADASGVRMPAFFGYMLYSVAVLVPLLAVVAFLAL